MLKIRLSIEPISYHSIKIFGKLYLNSILFFAGIAQLVEQRTENPRVTSSSLVPGNYYTK